MALNLLLNNAGLLADNFVHAMTEQSQNPSEWKVCSLPCDSWITLPEFDSSPR